MALVGYPDFILLVHAVNAEAVAPQWGEVQARVVFINRRVRPGWSGGLLKEASSISPPGSF